MAAGISLFMILWFGATYPAAAAKLPIVGRVFRYIQEKLEFGGNYEGYADEIGAVYSNNGISVTISEAYCDGTVLVLSYKVESKMAFRSYPEEFELNVSILGFGLQDNKNKDVYWIPGNWRFRVPVRVNGEDIKTYEIEQWNGEYSIDCVKVTSLITTVYTTYPGDEYEEAPFDYLVQAYGTLFERDISRMGRYDGVHGVTMIPTKEIGDRLDIYVVDTRGWTTEQCVKEEFEKQALVHAVINFEE